MVTIQFVSYVRLQRMSSADRVQFILKEAKTNKIVLLEGRLQPEEEALLIRTTMEQITPRFKGIELAVINSAAAGSLRGAVHKIFLGNRTGFTVIGPASIVKEIKKDPEKIELLMKR